MIQSAGHLNGVSPVTVSSYSKATLYLFGGQEPGF